jgi:hypothetical protein
MDRLRENARRPADVVVAILVCAVHGGRAELADRASPRPLSLDVFGKLARARLAVGGHELRIAGNVGPLF